MFDKTIVDVWEKNGITFLITIDDNGTLFLIECKPEAVNEY